jgi:hypothetical protein
MGEKEQPVNSTLGSLQPPAPTAGLTSGRASTETGGLPRQVFPRASGENDHRIYDGAAAEELWDALTRAREHYAPLVLTAAEDALLKFYQPLVREMSGSSSVVGVDPTMAEHTAEVALTQAIAGWDQRTSEGFDGYACAAMAFRLMDLPGARHAGNWPANSVDGTSTPVAGSSAPLR